jgi:23S rRNA (guanine745-N1)-methyltransferase
VLTLTRAEAALLVAMGPSSWHVDPADIAARLAELPGATDLPGRVRVTASADLRVYHPRA